MAGWIYTIERVEGGGKASGRLEQHDGGLPELVNILCNIAMEAYWRQMPAGDITEIKATRNKDGSVFVAVTGHRDRIFARLIREE